MTARRFTDEQEKGIAAEYEQGSSLPELAARHGVSITTVVNVLDRRGVARRPSAMRPGVVRRPPPELPPDEAVKALELYASGESAYAVARRFGTTTKGVMAMARRAGLEVRSGRVSPARQRRIDAMLKDYAAGLTQKEAAERSGGRRGDLSGLMRRRGLAARDCSHLTPERKAEAAARYAAGELPASIAADMGVSAQVASHAARKINGRAARKAGKPRSYALDEGAFDAPGPEGRYWVGMIMADGCVTIREGRGRTEHCLSVSLSGEDGPHLADLAKYLKTDRPISVCERPGGFGNQRPCHRVLINSKRVCDALARFGVTPRKSATAEVTGLEDCPDFWRGAVCGDGWITTNGLGCPVVGLCGSRRLCEQFLDFVNRKTRPGRAGVQTAKGMFRVTIGGKRAVALLKLLFYPGAVALPRKAALAEAVIAGRPSGA